MRSPKKTTAIVLAGAVGLSSVAYGIGTQADGGSSAAAGSNKTTSNNGAGQRGVAPPGFGGAARSGPGQARPLAQDLAQELGVDADALSEALRNFHERKRSDMRSAFATALGEALGKPAADVQAAFDALESERETRFAARLADALGVDADKVATALEELKGERPGPGGRGDHGDLAADLAEKLGLEAGDVETALTQLRPDKREGRRPHAMPLSGLAQELDVTRAELRKALREVRAGADFRPQDRRDELVTFLAERFNLSEAKVEAALPEFAGRGPGGPGGPGGPHRPGGPGGFGGPGPGGP